MIIWLALEDHVGIILNKFLNGTTSIRAPERFRVYGVGFRVRNISSDYSMHALLSKLR